MAGEQDRVRAEWQAVAGGWRRWEPLFQSFTWPLALRMAAAAQIGDGQRVLDVGCGIGDPTLQVAVPRRPATGGCSASTWWRRCSRPHASGPRRSVSGTSSSAPAT